MKGEQLSRKRQKQCVTRKYQTSLEISYIRWLMEESHLNRKILHLTSQLKRNRIAMCFFYVNLQTFRKKSTCLMLFAGHNAFDRVY